MYSQAIPTSHHMIERDAGVIINSEKEFDGKHQASNVEVEMSLARLHFTFCKEAKGDIAGKRCDY